MKNIYKTLVILAASMPFIANAQNPYVHQVIILNEGQYDYTNEVQLTPVTIGAYTTGSESYALFDTILGARFASDVVVNETHIYVAADTLLLEYDKFDFTLTKSTVVKGIRKLALWNNKVLVTRGELGGLNSYFQAYNMSDFSMAYELDSVTGPTYASDGIAVLNDTAYIAVNNSFEWGNYKGLLGLVDLNAEAYEAEIDLGTDAVNPENIMVDNGKLHILNNKDFTGSSVTSYTANSRNHTTTNVAFNSGCGSSALVADHVFYMEYNVGKVARYNVNTQSVVDTLATTLDYYGIETDTLNQLVYASYTDYSTYGKVYVLDYNGIPTDSFDVGVSPGNMAFDIRTSTGIEKKDVLNSFSVYPNPVENVLNFSVKVDDVVIIDVVGKTLIKVTGIDNKSIDVSALPAGIYVVNAKHGNYILTQKIVKQ